jgi:hypothetical protein
MHPFPTQIVYIYFIKSSLPLSPSLSPSLDLSRGGCDVPSGYPGYLRQKDPGGDHQWSGGDI